MEKLLLVMTSTLLYRMTTTLGKLTYPLHKAWWKKTPNNTLYLRIRKWLVLKVRYKGRDARLGLDPLIISNLLKNSAAGGLNTPTYKVRRCSSSAFEVSHSHRHLIYVELVKKDA